MTLAQKARQRKKAMPKLVALLTDMGCWVCGDQADFSLKSPTGWILFAPPSLWPRVVQYVSGENGGRVTLTFGGSIQLTTEGSKLEIWTGDFTEILPEARHFWLPENNVRVIRSRIDG